MSASYQSEQAVGPDASYLHVSARSSFSDEHESPGSSAGTSSTTRAYRFPASLAAAESMTAQSDRNSQRMQQTFAKKRREDVNSGVSIETTSSGPVDLDLSFEFVSRLEDQRQDGTDQQPARASGSNSPIALHPRGMSSASWSTRKRPPAPLHIQANAGESKQTSIFSPDSEQGSLVYDDEEPLPLTPLSATRRAADSGLSPSIPPSMSFLSSPPSVARPPIPTEHSPPLRSKSTRSGSDGLETSARSFRSTKSHRSSVTGRRSFETAASHNASSMEGGTSTEGGAEMSSVDSHRPYLDAESLSASVDSHQPAADIASPNELGLVMQSGLTTSPPSSLFRRGSLGDQATGVSARPASQRFRATHSSSNSFSSPFAALYHLGESPASVAEVASPSQTHSSPRTPFSPLFSDPGTAMTGTSQPTSSSMTPASGYQKLLPDAHLYATGRRQSADARFSSHMPMQSSIVRGASAPTERRSRGRKLDLERSRVSTGLPRSDTAEWIRRTGKQPSDGQSSDSDSEGGAEVLLSIEEDGEEKKSRRMRPPMVLNTSETASEGEGIFFPSSGPTDEAEEAAQQPAQVVRTRSKRTSGPWSNSPLLLIPSIPSDMSDNNRTPQPPLSPSETPYGPSNGLGLDLGGEVNAPVRTMRCNSTGYLSKRPERDSTLRQVEIDMTDSAERPTLRRLSDLPGWRTSKDYSEHMPHTAPVNKMRNGDDLQAMQAEAIENLRAENAGSSKQGQATSGDRSHQTAKDLQHSASLASSISAFAYQVTEPVPVPLVEETYLKNVRPSPAASPRNLAKALFPIRTSFGPENRSGWDDDDEAGISSEKWSSKLWNITAGPALALLRRPSVGHSSSANTVMDEPVSRRSSAQLRALRLVDGSPQMARSGSRRAAPQPMQHHNRARSRTVVSMHEQTWEDSSLGPHSQQAVSGSKSVPSSSPLQDFHPLPPSGIEADSPNTTATTATHRSDRTYEVASTAHTSEGTENHSRTSRSSKRGSRIYYVKSDASDVRVTMREAGFAEEPQVPPAVLDSLRSPRIRAEPPSPSIRSPHEHWGVIPVIEYDGSEDTTASHLMPMVSRTRESSGNVDVGLPSLPQKAVSRQVSDAYLAREAIQRAVTGPQSPSLSSVDFLALQVSRDRLRLLASQAMPGATLPHQYLSDDGEGLRKRVSLTRAGRRHSTSNQPIASQVAIGWTSGNNRRSSVHGGDMPKDATGAANRHRTSRPMSIFVTTSSIQAHLLRSAGVLQRPSRRRSSRSLLMTAPRKALESARPSRLLFYAGFLGMPWLWLVGGWWLTNDGLILTSGTEKVEVWEHEQSMREQNASALHDGTVGDGSINSPCSPSSAGHGESELAHLHGSHTASYASIAFRSPPLSAPNANRIPRRVSQSLGGVLDPQPGLAYFRSPVRTLSDKPSDSTMVSDPQSSPGGSPSRMQMPGGLDTLLEDESSTGNEHDTAIHDGPYDVRPFGHKHPELDRYVLLNRCAAGIASAAILAAGTAALWAVAEHF